MNLAFLLPAGFAALAALLLPLLLHLARRHEQKPTDFAALRWLRQKPKPRHRIRFDEWPLLLLRLLLLALLAAWLAHPVLSGIDDRTRWVVIAPGVDGTQARAQVGVEEDARLHWLAPGFPALDQRVPAGDVPLASLLRELDAQLPADTALTVVVPAVLQGADAQRPVLSRAVQWKVVDGAMASPPVRRSGPPMLVVRHAADSRGLRYLRAAAKAWSTSSSASDGLDAATSTQPIPPSARYLAWLVPGDVPAHVRAWTEQGGVLLLDTSARMPTDTAMHIAWRDGVGAPLMESTRVGRGRVVRFTRALDPAAMPELVDAEFPRTLRRLLEGEPPAPSRVRAVDYAPMTGAAAYPTAPRDLQPWLALLIALLVLVERGMATRRQRAVSP